MLLAVLGAAAWIGFHSSEHEAEEMFDARLATSARVLEALVARQLDTATVSKPIVITLPWPLEKLDDDDVSELGHYYETKIAFQVWNAEGKLLVRSSFAPTTPFAPLSELAQRIEGRHPASLDPVNLTRSPEEIVPVMKALNGLLVRIQDALARERRFTADAAHELRTPLAALKLHAENAVRASSDGARASSLQRLLTATRRTVRMAEQMLAYSRASAPVDTVAMQPLSLRTVVLDVVEEIQPRLAARSIRLALIVDPPDDDARVQGNYDKLASLVGNLLENAVRYGPPDATLRVEIAAGPSVVTLSILDEGPGIDRALRERVFESYFRVPGSAEGGTGLGLTIVKEIALQHGATIRIDDGIGGRGVRFTVSFPRVDDAPVKRSNRAVAMPEIDSPERTRSGMS